MSSPETTSGAAKLMAKSNITLSKSLVYAFAEIDNSEGTYDIDDAVVVGECALKEKFFGAEVRVRIAATSKDGETADTAFLNVCINSYWGDYEPLRGDFEAFDILKAFANPFWPRDFMLVSGSARVALNLAMGRFLAYHSSLLINEVHHSAYQFSRSNAV